MSNTTTSRFERHKQRAQRIHKHPFIVPVLTFLGLFIISSVVFVLAGAKTVQPTDSHMVKLYVDGKSQVLPSRAPTVKDLLDKSHITLNEGDVVEPGLDAQINDDNFSVNVYRSKPVTIVETSPQGVVTTKVTDSAQQAAPDIAKQAGITLYPEDKVELAPSADVLKEGIISQKVVIDRATPVNLNLYGNAIPTRTQAKTVGELLEEKNIKPIEGDTVTPGVEAAVTPNMQVFVLSNGKQIETKEEQIPMPVETVNDSSLPAGTNQVKQEGKPGKKLVTYEIQLQNGKEVGRKPIQEVVAEEPVKQIVNKGTKVVEMRIAGDKSAILAAAGVPPSQHYAADYVIARESGWNLGARNAGGCLGLGQACPGSKLVAACPSWQTDATCQIQFFSGYANGRYSGWQGALDFWLINHWW